MPRASTTSPIFVSSWVVTSTSFVSSAGRSRPVAQVDPVLAHHVRRVFDDLAAHHDGLVLELRALRDDLRDGPCTPVRLPSALSRSRRRRPWRARRSHCTASTWVPAWQAGGFRRERRLPASSVISTATNQLHRIESPLTCEWHHFASHAPSAEQSANVPRKLIGWRLSSWIAVSRAQCRSAEIDVLRRASLRLLDRILLAVLRELVRRRRRRRRCRARARAAAGRSARRRSRSRPRPLRRRERARLLARAPLEVLHDLRRLDRHAHREILRRVELRPIALGDERFDGILQVSARRSAIVAFSLGVRTSRRRAGNATCPVGSLPSTTLPRAARASIR